MEPADEYGGAAGMSGLWKSREGYDGSDPYLLLSGGDMWTGPAISTWFEGEPMAAVMKQMGYDAAALGNHEFDFTEDVLKVRLEEMDFPILAANFKEKATGNVPAFIKPYVVKTINDTKVGIIGLASLSTPFTGFPDYVADYEFTDYAEAVDTYAPVMQNEGADIILIIGHICLNEMEALVPTAKKYSIPFIGGGHCHQSVLQLTDGIVLAQTNGELREYIKVQLGFDKTNKRVKIVSKEAIANKGTMVDTKVEDIVVFGKTRRMKP
jgi:5'-nucleotidase/UDP-sugar diphosphatase